MVIRWLASARSDLKSIYEYIALDSKRYARLQVDRITSATQILKKEAYTGKSVKEFQNESIRELVEGNYRIIYKIVSPSEIHILLIHHGARDLKRRITK